VAFFIFRRKETMMFRVREAVVRYKTISSPIRSIGRPADVYDFFKSMVEGETRENFYCLYLDIKNKVICFEKIAMGTSTAVNIDPKEIIRTGLLVGAERLILAHNHPSGDSTPSPEDGSLTIKVGQISNMFNMELLDHVVVGDGQFTSLKERGIL